MRPFEKIFVFDKRLAFGRKEKIKRKKIKRLATENKKRKKKAVILLLYNYTNMHIP